MLDKFKNKIKLFTGGYVGKLKKIFGLATFFTQNLSYFQKLLSLRISIEYKAITINNYLDLNSLQSEFSKIMSVKEGFIKYMQSPRTKVLSKS